MPALTPKQALNKAFLKLRPARRAVEGFQAALGTLLDRVSPGESEEFHKNLITDFLNAVGFAPDHYINTKGRNDLVIHNGDSSRSSVGVIIETKSPGNSAEMPRPGQLNTKALQELLLYYLRERVTHNNLELRHLVVTNVHEWYLFDARDFEARFAHDRTLTALFNDFEAGRLAGGKTRDFYKDIAAPALDAALPLIEFVHLDFRDFDVQSSTFDVQRSRSSSPPDFNVRSSTFDVRRSLSSSPPSPSAPADAETGAPVPFVTRHSSLVIPSTLLSPTHLLKLPFTNDSNSLDKGFYSELLHIIGLTERKEGSKKLIERKPPGGRDPGSLLENAITQLDSLDKLSRLDRPGRYGADRDERLFNVALELAITWTNRILFLKLLEAQLIAYHKGDREHAFLHSEKVGSYDELNSLFFEVLARLPAERGPEMARKFARVPYLNSSLFEPADIEHGGLTISQLKNRELPLHPATVLKDPRGRRRAGSMDALAYFFAFLDAYDFTAEGAGEIQEENKTLINASVLGLIFEKINGYKDGSFFTPGFITMYMCRETLHRAVLRKFHEAKGWSCATIPDLAERIEDKSEANALINSLRICDPAVGSGHFLVSALNEIIALKSALGILCDREGRRLKNLHVEVVNDELILTDEDGDFFEYKPRLPESRRIQEALFHEKQTLIENCLFGVDLNPNSVKICRLRLWIELLKHAYYKNETELETLPNIDINIKCGNSLISRFALDADLKTALRKSKWTIDSYRRAVMSYRNAQNKEHKREMERLIDSIKGDFEAEITYHDTRATRLRKLKGRLNELTLQTQLFEKTAKEKAAWNKEVKSTTAAITKLEEQLEEIRKNKIYENAFEWRFEFPEVLDNDGHFTGFDILIGNPPYVQIQSLPADIKAGLADSDYRTFVKSADLYCLFFERALQLLRPQGQLTFITSSKFFRASYGQALREHLQTRSQIHEIVDFGELPVFEEAATDPAILLLLNEPPAEDHKFSAATVKDEEAFKDLKKFIQDTGITMAQKHLDQEAWALRDEKSIALLQKLQAAGSPLGEYVNKAFYRGLVTGLNEAFVVTQETKDKLIQEDPQCEPLFRKWLRGQDLKRWKADYQGLYAIIIASSANVNWPWSGKSPEEAERIFAERYPSIFQHMVPFKQAMQKRTDKGQYYWELRSCAYLDAFDKPKIIYPDIAKNMRACLDTEGCFGSNTLYFIPLDDPLILTLLNSDTFDWYARQTFQSLGDPWKGGRLRFFTQYMENAPIPPATEAQKAELSDLAQACAAATAAGDTERLQTLETRIDEIVCGLFDLNAKEIEQTKIY
ncbi:MAG: Eco57I restriction-modification methylase domain-containing protein [Kiritimatiellae bacterium]|nr:Eco57I restriction-modification methylase domain-containing protein [Kiritimatiellia bacterium]